MTCIHSDCWLKNVIVSSWAVCAWCLRCYFNPHAEPHPTTPLTPSGAVTPEMDGLIGFLEDLAR